MSCDSCVGPGYKSPADAINGPKEKILYTVLIHCDESQPDCLATIDVDEKSTNYKKIINLLKMPYNGDELHHFGWNACSSCCDDKTKKRRYLVLVGQKSSRIYFVDTIDPINPKIFKIIEPDVIKNTLNLSAPHTVHCLASGKIMISMLGDKNGNAPGGFCLIDENFDVHGRWGDDNEKKVSFNYDYWYQPYFNIMVSSEWSAPNTYFNGFDVSDVAKGKYGKHIHFWDWTAGKILKSVDLGDDGLIPLELRFHHNPKSSHGYVGAALSSSVWHWYQDEKKEWQVEKVIQVEPVDVEGWPFPVPGLITDLLISMDDRFLYFSDWFHGDLRQYDISDPSKPKLVGQLFLGGLIGKTVTHKGKKLNGGPQMIQLSLDGQRIYVTNSLISKWDNQFYPDLATKGSHMLKVNVNTDKGGLELDKEFFVDFENIEKGPYRAHEMRYPGGDCTSDIWLAT